MINASVVAFLMVISLAIFWPKTVKADVDYDIDSVTVNAKVQRNGSLLIKRKIKYSFDSSAHGVYYKQNLNQNQKIKDPQVTVQDNKGKTIKVTPGDGQNNSYQLTKNSEGYRFKVFHNIADDSDFTVTYAYQITNAIINWADTAELNFKIIGDGWDRDLDHVKAVVEVNNGQKVHSLNAWAHGQLSGYTDVNHNKGLITMTADDVPGDEGIEVHAIFPKSITALNTNTRNKKHKQFVLKQEAQFAREANERRRRKKMLDNTIVVVAAIVASLLSIFIVIKSFRIKQIGVKPKKTKELAHNYDIPDVTPVQARILDRNDEPDSVAFTAYLTYLAGKKRIAISKLNSKFRSNYEIKLLDPKVKEENPVLKYIFNKIGDGESFTTKKLRKNHSSKLGKTFDKWSDAQYDKVEDKGYLDPKVENKRNRMKGLMIADIVILIAFAVLMIMFASSRYGFSLLGLDAFLMVIDAIAFIHYFRHVSEYTAKGAEETNRIRGFKKMLKDIGHFNVRDVGELILWEDIMPYAVAFELSDKVIEELHKNFSKQEFIDAGFDSGFWIYMGSDNNDFAESFSSSLTSGLGSSSSTGGSSGGFSGGNSGGFGGGSGGGAF